MVTLTHREKSTNQPPTLEHHAPPSCAHRSRPPWQRGLDFRGPLHTASTHTHTLTHAEREREKKRALVQPPQGSPNQRERKSHAPPHTASSHGSPCAGFSPCTRSPHRAQCSHALAGRSGSPANHTRHTASSNTTQLGPAEQEKENSLINTSPQAQATTSLEEQQT